jgi:hypothetical protein
LVVSVSAGCIVVKEWDGFVIMEWDELKSEPTKDKSKALKMGAKI